MRILDIELDKKSLEKLRDGITLVAEGAMPQMIINADNGDLTIRIKLKVAGTENKPKILL